MAALREGRPPPVDRGGRDRPWTWPSGVLAAPRALVAVAAVAVVVALVVSGLVALRMGGRVGRRRPRVRRRCPSPAPFPTGPDPRRRPRPRRQPGIVVHAAGAVRTPGLYRLDGGARVADLLAVAGGPADDVDLDRVNLAAPLVDGQRVYVPRVGEEVPPAVGTGGTGPGEAGGGRRLGGSGRRSTQPPSRSSTRCPAWGRPRPRPSSTTGPGTARSARSRTSSRSGGSVRPSWRGSATSSPWDEPARARRYRVRFGAVRFRSTRPMGDLASVGLAASVVAGAWWAPPVPVAAAIAVAVFALWLGRPTGICLAGALLAAALATQAWAGLAPLPSHQFRGTVRLVTDPERAFGAWRADVRTDEGRMELWARGAPGARLGRMAAGQRLSLVGRVEPLTQPEWGVSRHVRGRLTAATVDGTDDGGLLVRAVDTRPATSWCAAPR